MSESGIGTDPSKVEAVRTRPIPTNLRKCRAFIVLFQYYRRFVPNFSAVAAPLHALTKKGASFLWTLECQQAFDQLKSVLSSAEVHTLRNDDDHFILDCDEKAMVAVLSQIQNGEESAWALSTTLFKGHPDHSRRLLIYRRTVPIAA